MMTPLLIALLPALALAAHHNIPLNKNYLDDTYYVAEPHKYFESMHSAPLIKSTFFAHPSSFMSFAKSDVDSVYPSAFETAAFSPATKFFSASEFAPTEKFFPVEEVPTEKFISSEFHPLTKYFAAHEPSFFPATKFISSDFHPLTKSFATHEPSFFHATKFISPEFHPATKFFATHEPSFFPATKFISSEFQPATKFFTTAAHEPSFPAGKFFPVSETGSFPIVQDVFIPAKV